MLSRRPLDCDRQPESANIAQLVEQLTRNEQVSGSSPDVGFQQDPVTTQVTGSSRFLPPPISAHSGMTKPSGRRP